jgi:ribosomal protein L40E
MAKFPDQELAKAAHDRLMANKFVCRRCHGVTKGQNLKVLAGAITCRRCGYKRFKPKRKK